MVDARATRFFSFDRRRISRDDDPFPLGIIYKAVSKLCTSAFIYILTLQPTILDSVYRMAVIAPLSSPMIDAFKTHRLHEHIQG